MTGKKPEIRNMKGEVVQDSDDGERWYHFSGSTGLLIGGLVLFNLGCFFNPNMLGGVFRFFDFRLWLWWYLVTLALIVAFSIKWFLLFRSWDDLDSEEIDIAKRFLCMSITVTAIMLILVLSNMTGLLRIFYDPLRYWISYGAYSHMGLLTFFLICGIVGIIAYVVKEWLITLVSS